MTEFSDILRRHAAAYPAMEPADAVKLCYQAEFGGAHLQKDPYAARSALLQEWPTAPSEGVVTEACGETISRLYLGPAREQGLSPERVVRLFADSARPGSADGFRRRLDILRAEIDAFSFSPAAIEDFLAGYDFQDLPPLSHSDAYRRRYRPSYRLIQTEDGLLLPLLCAMDAILKKQGRVTVAFDGMCGSGKTTLSKRVQALYDAALLHMDDFFLPPHLRTPQRQAECNVHAERFQTEVLEPLSEGRAIVYRPFSCQTGDYLPPVSLPPGPVTLIEGTYSCHPCFGSPYDLRVFVETDPEEQARRIRQRNPERYEAFRTLWIPLENQYFTRHEIRAQAHLLIRT